MKKTVNIRIERLWKKEDYTIGRLYINDQFLCNTMERKDRGLHNSMTVAQIKSLKVDGTTAIPDGGPYQVIKCWSPRFGKEMYRIVDVKGFSGILFHSGAYPVDSAGCILLGDNKSVGMLTNSRLRMKQFEQWLDSLKADKITLTIV